MFGADIKCSAGRYKQFGAGIKSLRQVSNLQGKYQTFGAVIEFLGRLLNFQAG